jgi:MraZ protein
MDETNRTDATQSCFHGSYTRSVDAKGRFNLPFRFRRSGPAHADERYVVSDGPDGTLNLLPYGEFVAAFNRARGLKRGQGQRAELRRISHNSRVVEPDSQGRIAIAPDVLAPYGIGRKVLVVGMGNYMELWDPDSFTAQHEGLAPPDSAFMDEFYG